MTGPAAKQVSNPFSTGGGGVNFELQVQASFVALMLAGGFAPCLPCRPIQKIKLQARYAGYDIDDLIVFTASANGSDQCKLLGQIKHSISITAGDVVFGEVIAAAWRDFNNPRVFTKGKDAIALITGPLSATDIADGRTLFEWARSSESAQEFLTKVETAKFSSDAKRTKLKAFRSHLDTANGSTVSDGDFVEFLRHFNLLGYDLDIRSGLMHAMLHSLIGHYSRENAASLWTQIVQEVMSANQSAGTITRDSLSDDLRNAFAGPEPQRMPEALSRSVAPREAHAWQTSEFASALVVANLLGAWDENTDADMTIAARLAGGERDAWISSMREVLQLPDSPLHQQNGVWAVRDRGALWEALGSRIFDGHLENLKECAELVLREHDPQFELDADSRFSAAIYGKVLEHSSHLRKGLAESLALLGARPEPLTNCTEGNAQTTAVLAVRAIFDGADWIGWGSLNDVLPLLAEAAPDEFLSAVEHALAATPCLFDAIFAQEGGGIGGRSYLTGLLWALETLAWEDEFLVHAVVALGALAERDPGGQWANRPSNSLTMILLPWFPQTVASILKRKVAVETLLRESPDAAWALLLNLLPTKTGVSSGGRKPLWRRTIPTDWKDRPTQEEYWQQVAGYADLAADAALADVSRLIQLIEHLDHLPKAVVTRTLTHLASPDVTDAPEDAKLSIWSSLTDVARKHRRFADAEWALPGDVVAEIESAAATIEPQKPQNLYRELFAGRDWDLYEETGDWQEQENKLEARRQDVLRDLLRSDGIDVVIEFAEVMEAPMQVGFSLGSLGEPEVEERILPSLLDAEDDRHKHLAAGFVSGSFRQRVWPWVDSIDAAGWSQMQIGLLLSCLPFANETWERAKRLLGEGAAEYWTRCAVNPYQAEGDLYTAVDQLLEHGRPRAAIDCLARLGDEQALDEKRAARALLEAVSSSEPTFSLHTHHVSEVIGALQDDPNADEDALLKVEWAYLPLLNKNNRGAPKTLERRLVSDPMLFGEMVRMVFRSKNDQPSDTDPSAEQKAAAENAYRLLQDWQTPPGTVATGGFDGDAFTEWMEAVRKSAEESGHLEVALHQAGGVLLHCPDDPDGLWIHRSVAEVLNQQNMEELRRGYSIAIFNSRGAHFVDPKGEPELELARKYRTQAEESEIAGYQRLAAMLRGVADTYEREAKAIVVRHASEVVMGEGE